MTRAGRHPRRGGFAAVMAIVLIGLVASALAAMAMMFAADARRTRAAAAEAQLRQLLIAAAADVRQRLDNGQTSFDVKAAAPGGGEVQVSAMAEGEGDVINAAVVATIAPRRSSQALRFTRDGQKWKLAAVTIGS